jgi:signal peptidase I
MRHGILYINGVPVERDRLAEPLPLPDGVVPASAVDYIEHLPMGPSHVVREMGDEMPLDDTEIFTVPAHHYFFMGDNRDNSQDSRTMNVRFVPEENLVGRAEFLFFSIEEGAKFWQFWRWPWSVRWSRLFMKVR